MQWFEFAGGNESRAPLGAREALLNMPKAWLHHKIFCLKMHQLTQ